MAKGSLVDLPIIMDPRRVPSSQSFNTPPSSRASVLASVVPYFRRHETDDIPTHQKQPLLALQLSSFSFLNSLVTDDATHQPLYTISTRGATTTIKRADAWDGDTKIAEIKWPSTPSTKGKGVSDGVIINLRGTKWKGSETLLRRSSILSGPKKFNIPNYGHNLKWKCIGNVYWCTTAAVKGPIASFKPATDTLPPQFEIFETLHDKKDIRPMLVHHGVSILLLDYLLVTALFLVTDYQDWTHVDKYESQEITIPVTVPDLNGLTPPKSAPGNISTTDLQWRKIMYGEPLFPKRTSHSSLNSGSTTPDTLHSTTISAEQMAKVAYGRPLYPNLRSSSPDPSSSGSEDADEQMFFPTLTHSVSRPESPSSESIFYPLTRGGAPSHTYIDPSFYQKDEEIPVPPIPPRFTVSPSGSGYNYTSRSRPSSSHSTASTSARRLPDPPLPPMPPPVLPLIIRPRSTPPRAMTSPIATQQTVISDAAIPSGSTQAPSITPSSTPRRPTRQLPQPPTSTSTTPQPPRNDSMHHRIGIGRARSHSQSHYHRQFPQDGSEKWRSRAHASYGQRTLPPPPTSSSGPHESRAISDRGPFPYPKDAEDDLDLARWVVSPVPLTGSTYDMPPPAYNTINFSSRAEDTPDSAL